MVIIIIGELECTQWNSCDTVMNYVRINCTDVLDLHQDPLANRCLRHVCDLFQTTFMIGILLNSNWLADRKGFITNIMWYKFAHTRVDFDRKCCTMRPNVTQSSIILLNGPLYVSGTCLRRGRWLEHSQAPPLTPWCSKTYVGVHRTTWWEWQL